MKLIQSSIRYPVSVIVGIIIATIGGLLALTEVPIQLTPEVQRPHVNVTTSWPGASPEEIEKEIIDQQEDYLKSVEGLLEMNSESSDGYGSITLEFPAGADITGAIVRVTNKLNEVPSYPATADRPVISTSGPFERAIAWFVIKGEDSVYVPNTKTMVEDLIKPRLERVEGVSSINIFGGLEQELHVNFDPDLLAFSGVTISELRNALRADNYDISGGDFGEGKRRYVVRTISRFETIESVKQTIIKIQNGVPILVGDIAEVTLGYRKPTAQVRHKGVPALAFNAQRQIGSNVLEVMDGLLEQVDIINEEILQQRGMHLENVYSETIYINSAINQVFTNLYLGGFLAILIMFLFLRSVSSILVIGISIPISVISAFMAMYFLGRTINVISLAGMAFAVGMVVDNSIVVLENIYRHLQLGKDKFKAAVDGTREVWGAVLASTLTTVAVFLPIMFVQERAGQLFRDIAIAIASAIIISLIVAITVIPMLSSKFLKISSKMGMGNANGDNWLSRVSVMVASFVDFINAKMTRRISTIAAMVVVSLGFTFLFLPDAEYLPNGNQNFVFGFMLPPPGYNLDEMIGIGQSVESQLSYLWETPEEESDTLPGQGVDNFFFVAMPGQAFMGLRSRDDSRVRELLPVANQALGSVPGAIGFANQASLFSGGFSGTRSVKIDITGPELDKVLGIAMQVFGQVGEVLPGSSSRPIPGLDLGNPEVRVYPDRTRAADAGFRAIEIGQAVNALVDGAIVSSFWHEGRELDLVIKGSDKWTRHTQDIAQLPMATPAGSIISLGDIADIKLRQGPVQINHVERVRAVSILANLPDDIPLERAIDKINNEIVRPMRDQGQLGSLYDINLSGSADDLSKLRGALQRDFLLAIILTYLLLSALFQSFTYPLVIMVTVPLATFGGVMGLRLVQLFDSMQQLDILTMLGFVILVGTVINNSILIVYQALHYMREGSDARSAVKESVRVRVRPIFMSTATSALGMLPLVVLPGAGSELYRGLGSVVVGGLVLSSVITLVLTPLVFSYALELKSWIRSKLGMSDTDLAIAPQIDVD